MIRPLLARDRDRYPPYRCPSPKRASLTFLARFARPPGPRKPHPRGPPRSFRRRMERSRYLLRHSVNSLRKFSHASIHYFNIIRNEADKRGDPLCRNFRRNCHYRISTRNARSCTRPPPLPPLSLSLSLSVSVSVSVSSFLTSGCLLLAATELLAELPRQVSGFECKCDALRRHVVEGDLEGR